MSGRIQMRNRIQKAVLAFVLLVAAAYLGYLYRDREAAFEAYDEVLLSLGADIYMLDAVEADKDVEAKAILVSKIEGEAARMAGLYKQHGFSERDYGRCVVTKKLRALHKRKLILDAMPGARHPDYPLLDVVSYLNTTCEGEPSHKDWTDVKRLDR